MRVKGRSILGFFATRETAELAEKRLREAGYDVVEVDRVSKYPGKDTEELHNPLTGTISSLADLTMGASAEGADEGILLSADPTASGLAEGTGVHEKGWMITVVCDEDRVDRAVRIIKECGGTV